MARRYYIIVDRYLSEFFSTVTDMDITPWKCFWGLNSKIKTDVTSSAIILLISDKNWSKKLKQTVEDHSYKRDHQYKIQLALQTSVEQTPHKWIYVPLPSLVIDQPGTSSLPLPLHHHLEIQQQFARFQLWNTGTTISLNWTYKLYPRLIKYFNKKF